MEISEIKDPLFRKAVEAIDHGDLKVLEDLLSEHPRLTTQPLNHPGTGYFSNPYLIWFIAGNPVRSSGPPPNIINVTELIIKFLKQNEATNLAAQLNYTIGLISTTQLPADDKIQTTLLDVLIDSGGSPGGALAALASGNTSAAKYHLKKGEKISLPVAIGLDNASDVVLRLSTEAGPSEKLLALTVASFFGHKHFISLLLSIGTDPNGFPGATSGFHSHATPLHQAVSSGCLESVQLLVRTGARIDQKDTMFHHTPLGWADYLIAKTDDSESKKKFIAIRQFLNEEKNR